MSEPAQGIDACRKRTGFRERGGGWVLGQFVLMTLIVAAGGVYPGSGTRTWTFGVALALMGLGGVVGILGALHLGKNRTAFPKPLKEGELIETGIYGWIRHPLYSSLILLGLGWSLNRWSAWAGLATLGLACFLDAKARREELWLEQVYPGYGQYRKRVRRFIPGLY
jgi:protein-S-isoprenylcysteine O-methyltransferase Ste14